MQQIEVIAYYNLVAWRVLFLNAIDSLGEMITALECGWKFENVGIMNNKQNISFCHIVTHVTTIY